MYRLRFILVFIILSVNPIFAKDQVLRTTTSFASNSERFLGLQNSSRSFHKSILKFDVNYELNNLSSQLSLNYAKDNNFNIDGSYLQFYSGKATFGIGAIDRHWSFSDKTSLILSHNARPFKSVYMELSNKFGFSWLPSKANWSLEVFNGVTEGSLQNTESMLLGVRAILSPVAGLNFELVQTSQWGGDGYSDGISPLGAALFLDTNDSINSNINKMAGFGISYSTPKNIIPLRIYGQAVGEDEAGNLPSCYGYLAGLEWSNIKIKYPTTIGIEAVDTRIDRTANGNCGPNTMYHNTTYDYINYGDTMGASIDTEGNSLELFGQSQISQKTDIQYSIKLITINDNNWERHRLSSKKQSGLINSLGATWSKNNIKLNGNIYYQDFSLDKAKIKEGYGFSFSSTIVF